MTERVPLFPRIRVWAILGDARTGKSTTIRYLSSQLSTGPGAFRDVLLRGGGYLRVYSVRRAWQEAGKSPREAVERVNRSAQTLVRQRPPVSVCCVNVLMALRFNPTNECPAGHAYLSHFVGQGWLLESLVLMNYRDEDRREFYHNFGAPTLDLFDSARMVRNPDQHAWMVGQVRNHFGWA